MPCTVQEKGKTEMNLGFLRCKIKQLDPIFFKEYIIRKTKLDIMLVCLGWCNNTTDWAA